MTSSDTGLSKVSLRHEGQRRSFIENKQNKNNKQPTGVRYSIRQILHHRPDRHSIIRTLTGLLQARPRRSTIRVLLTPVLVSTQCLEGCCSACRMYFSPDYCSLQDCHWYTISISVRTHILVRHVDNINNRWHFFICAMANLLIVINISTWEILDFSHRICRANIVQTACVHASHTHTNTHTQTRATSC